LDLKIGVLKTSLNTNSAAPMIHPSSPGWRGTISISFLKGKLSLIIFRLFEKINSPPLLPFLLKQLI